MTPRRALSAALALGLAVALTAQTAAAADRSFGVWRNPKNSVHIRVQPCGGKMCGVVVWASDKAKADAAKGSSAPLVGASLFREFHQEQPGLWRGKVFVPDIGKTFSGTIRVLDPQHIEGRGCLVGTVGCKTQVWTRLPN